MNTGFAAYIETKARWNTWESGLILDREPYDIFPTEEEANKFKESFRPTQTKRVVVIPERW